MKQINVYIVVLDWDKFIFDFQFYKTMECPL